MSKRIPFVEITRNYVGAPYRLGGFGSEGYDCLSLIILIGRDLGFDVPTSFGGYDTATYPSLWRSDVGKAKLLFLNYVLNIAKEISVNRIFVPDLILVNDGEDDFFGIVVGNGNMLSSFIDLGVRVKPIRQFEVKRAFRWVQKAQGLGK